VRFTLPRPASVSLEVADAAGRIRRRILSSRAQPAGNLTLTWDGRDDAGRPVPSGTYFLRLRAAGLEETVRAIRIE